MTIRHIYVDETKERGYLVVAAKFSSADVDSMRKSLRSLVLRGQSRIHMAKESNQRRRTITAAITGMGVTATVYDAGRRYSDPLDARRAYLEGILSDVEQGEQTYLVLEQDDSIIDWDRQQLVELTRVRGCRHAALRAPSSESGLIADRPGRDRVVLGTRWSMATVDSADSGRRAAGIEISPRWRETRPAHRPEGCRVHFLKLNATDASEYTAILRHDRGSENGFASS